MSRTIDVCMVSKSNRRIISLNICSHLFSFFEVLPPLISHFSDKRIISFWLRKLYIQWHSSCYNWHEKWPHFFFAKYAKIRNCVLGKRRPKITNLSSKYLLTMSKERTIKVPERNQTASDKKEHKLPMPGNWAVAK